MSVSKISFDKTMQFQDGVPISENNDINSNNPFGNLETSLSEEQLQTWHQMKEKVNLAKTHCTPGVADSDPGLFGPQALDGVFVNFSSNYKKSDKGKFQVNLFRNKVFIRWKMCLL